MGRGKRNGGMGKEVNFDNAGIFFFSGGLVFGIVNIVGNFGAVFCDQAYWQSSVAAKPLQVTCLFFKPGFTLYIIKVQCRDLLERKPVFSVV